MFDAPVSATAAVESHDSVAPPLNQMMAALLDEIDTGVILCDAGGRLLISNHAARQELESGGALRLVGCRLQSADPPQLRQALQAAATSRRRQLLMLGHADQRVLACALPMPLQVEGRPCIALMLGRRGQRRELAIELLAGLFRLTGSERKVLLGLVAGKRAHDIAQDRGVAISTVRTQIQAMRNKTGAASICAMLGLVAELPPVNSALRGCCPLPRA